MVDLGLIVEGHCEYDSLPSIISKIPNTPSYVPIVNAGGIGNIIKNTDEQLLALIKLCNPKKIIITLDYRDALRDGHVSNCIELKNKIIDKCTNFMSNPAHAALNLPQNITVVIADKTFETWICADLDSLKNNEFFNPKLITEEFVNVDLEISHPAKWLESKLKKNADIKNRRNRVKIYKKINPEIARLKSRSFDKFYREASNTIS